MILDISQVLRERARLSVIRLLDMRLTQCRAFRAFRSALRNIPIDISYIQARNALHSQLYYDARRNISKKSHITESAKKCCLYCFFLVEYIDFFFNKIYESKNLVNREK